MTRPSTESPWPSPRSRYGLFMTLTASICRGGNEGDEGGGGGTPTILDNCLVCFDPIDSNTQQQSSVCPLEADAVVWGDHSALVSVVLIVYIHTSYVQPVVDVHTIARALNVKETIIIIVNYYIAHA